MQNRPGSSMAPISSSPACDRCHAIKVKCIPSNTFAGCCRCFRLQHKCSNSRRRGMPGRKKKRQDVISLPPAKLKYCWMAVPTATEENDNRSKSWTSSDSDESCSIEDNMPLEARQISSMTVVPRECCDPLLSDRQLLWSLTWQDQMAEFYAVASSFVPKLSAKVQLIICRGPPILADLYLALKRVMNRVQSGQMEHDKSDVLTSSFGLEVLRNTSVYDKRSLVSFLWLGIFLKSFDRLVLGTSTHLIYESTILQLRTWYDSVSKDPETIDPIVCLLFNHAVTCVINRQVPYIKFEPPYSRMIDRYAGLCCDLLPMMYDTCRLVAAENIDENSPDISSWQDVHQRVQAWQPQFSAKILSKLSANEVTTLLAQAHAYRLATILILNRTRHPSDVQHSYAVKVLVEMENCLFVTGQPPPHSILPLFIAALELMETEDQLKALRVLQLCRGASYYPYMSRLPEMCHEFWQQRDAEGSPDWLTYLDKYRPLNIPL